jgi:cyclopropane-fatty-acyl-phospholipid synthase
MSTTATLQTDTSQHAAIARRILDQVFPAGASDNWSVRLWNGEAVRTSTVAPPRFTLVLNRPGALRRMFWPPGDLALGEAYLRGDFDVEGDLISAVGLGDSLLAGTHSQTAGDWLRLVRSLLSLPNDAPPSTVGRRAARLAGAKHSRARDKAAIAYHYDVGNRFYSLWLGHRMQYSCAYFRTGEETIDEAQEAKLDIICRKLRLQPGERLLDIGCGWGGLAMFAAERYGVNSLGLTLSAPQVEYANERIRAAGLSGRVQVKMMDYRDLTDESFDKIVSVGMFEHVGRAHLHEYFSHAHRLLRPRGAFLNHGIASGGRPAASQRLTRLLRLPTFSERYVFPDGELVSVEDALAFATSVGFEVRDVDSWREHYAQTLRLWVAGLEAHREEARRLVDERTYRVWRLYMSGSAHGFLRAQLNVYETLLIKPDTAGISGQPWTREGWYSTA